MSKVTEQLWKRYGARMDSDVQRDTYSRHRAADDLHEDYIHLEHRVNKLTMICRALFEMLADKNGWSEDDLVAKVAEIDLRDGVLDGKVTPRILDCPQCGRKVNSRNHHCLYCGFSEFKHDVFGEV